MANNSEFEAMGHERPRAANQMVGGSRAVSIWGVGILAKSLRSALQDEHLLDHLASELKAGDRFHISTYQHLNDYRSEQRAETVELVITKVQRPEHQMRTPGRVWWRELAYTDLREGSGALMIEDMREIAV